MTRGLGNFFYSRRIGQSVQFNESDFINDGEELIDYDERFFNQAGKISPLKQTKTVKKFPKNS